MLTADPGNPQAHLRLGFAELERERCDAAGPHLQAALDAGVPSADAGLGLAECLGRAGNVEGARRALAAALRAEPGNPVATANLGILALEQDRPAEAIPLLREALARRARACYRRGLRWRGHWPERAIARRPSPRPASCWRSFRPTRRNAPRSNGSSQRCGEWRLPASRSSHLIWVPSAPKLRKRRGFSHLPGWGDLTRLRRSAQMASCVI